MLQNAALLAGSCGSVASWYARAVTGSSDSANWSCQRNSKRARESARSQSAARGCCLARSAACAAMRYAMTPCLTSSRSGRPRCSLGVT